MITVQKSFVSHEQASGTLYLVGTPIGNLEDMTYRAVRTLTEVDLIAAEDTRQTRKLLTHFNITKRLVSYHEHNKLSSGPELIRMLEAGQSIALVSDAGLPAIADPGADLVAQAIAHQIAVVPIPGANAALSSLIVSGLPTEQFIFLGFPPRDKKDLKQWLESHRSRSETMMFYEAPHRLEKTLVQLLDVWGNRQISIGRELTKRHEEFVRGTIEESIVHFTEHAPRGEFCLIVEGSSESQDANKSEQWWLPLSLKDHVAHYEQQLGDRKQAIKLVAVDRGMPKREVYNAML